MEARFARGDPLWTLLASPAVAGGARSGLQAEGESLRQRLHRRRFQEQYQARSRAATAAYIVCALRDLGWTPDMAALPIETLAESSWVSRRSIIAGSP